MTGGQGQILDAESLDIVVTRTEPLQLPGTSNAMQPKTGSLGIQLVTKSGSK
jgi:hypothetical protein